MWAALTGLENLPSVLGAAAALFSAIATLFAAVATYRGPKAAAYLAEAMRKETEKETEKRRLKLHVFATLMQERAAYYSLEAVRSFNLIDIVYYENHKVRDAWAEFLQALDESNKVTEHGKSSLFRALLSAMAEDLSLGGDLRIDDFGRVYHPTALAEEENVRLLERRASLARLQGNTSPAANSGSPQLFSPFPPPPQS
jgi:hypothetical protein